MAVSKSLLISTAPGGEPAKKPRVYKKDREFSPPELGLRPSRYKLADRLYDHFQRARDDGAYRSRYEAFVRYETIIRHAQDAELAAAIPPAKVLRVRASEIKTCSRQTAMRLMGFKPTASAMAVESPWWNIAALSGGTLHESIEIALKFLGVSKRSEFTVGSEDGTLSGRVDHELDPDAFSEELGLLAAGAILDVKTVNEKAFKDGCWGDKVPGYIAQVSAYARLTGNTVGVVLLVDRGSGRLMDFEWTVDNEYADRVLLRANKITERAVQRRLPKAEAFVNGSPVFTCTAFCPFFRQCAIQEEDNSIQFKLDNGANPREL